MCRIPSHWNAGSVKPITRPGWSRLGGRPQSGEPARPRLAAHDRDLAAGLSSGMVVNGSLSKTAVNGGAGARSQVSGLVVAELTPRRSRR